MTRKKNGGRSTLNGTHRLAIIAASRANAGRGILQRGMCQAWTRECYEQLYGLMFEDHHKASAHLAMRSWQNTPYAVDASEGSLPGDILYIAASWRNRHGHVGIRVLGNRIAENSTRRSGRVRGGVGFVSLAEFGRVSLIVRLPRA